MAEDQCLIYQHPHAEEKLDGVDHQGIKTPAV